jgi:hypothetical protein
MGERHFGVRAERWLTGRAARGVIAALATFSLGVVGGGAGPGAGVALSEHEPVGDR